MQVLDLFGNFVRGFGAKSVGLFNNSYGVHGITLQWPRPPDRQPRGVPSVVVTDTIQHTLIKFSRDGDELDVIGTPGAAGDGLDPIQFGNVAEAAVGLAGVMVSDGDAGVNNRLVGFDLALNVTQYVVGPNSSGTGPAEFSSPHR